jgi:DNA-directed RNA polymerase specialized sigma24 family protein
MVRLADLLGADDPEDIAQEAFARLLKRHDTLRDPDAALAYVRAIVCNLTRNRHRHLRVVRLRLGGKQYGAQTTAGWPGSGLRLWSFPVPASMLSSSGSRVMLGYDAAGRVVWQKNLLAAR